jgi:hypothetical protein
MQRGRPLFEAHPANREPGAFAFILLSGDLGDIGVAKDPSPVLANYTGDNDALMRLEDEVHELRKEVADLKQQFEGFRKALE